MSINVDFRIGDVSRTGILNTNDSRIGDWIDKPSFITTGDWYPTTTYIQTVPMPRELVTETVSDGLYTLVFEIPGFKKSEVTIEVTNDNFLMVIAKKETKQVSLSRGVSNQADLDTVTASLEDGLLTVTYKNKSKPAPRKVTIK
jgi:Hsp20/alpha crystallin family